MKVFNLRNQLVEDYAAYINSFITIQDQPIKEKVAHELENGTFWPDPLIQLNPNFEQGAWIDDLVGQNLLAPLAANIFRLGKTADSPNGQPMQLYRHQTEALEAAATGDSYVLTTGTGSGKSLAYIVPIVNHILKQGSGKGVQAIVVYPMNALANSQLNELDKYLSLGFDTPPVTYRRYTGQEKSAERDEIIANPPDIILTNYVMLELILTRPRERNLVEALHGLQFVVLDELHTYRGRQGADVAMLVRRVKNLSKNPRLQCVGTSATLAGGGTFDEQRVEVARVASTIFGAQVKPERVIGETLRRATAERDIENPFSREMLTERVKSGATPPEEYSQFINDPLSIWIEATFGLTTEPETGRLKRAEPLSITGEDGAAARLAQITGEPVEKCVAVIEEGLLGGYKAIHNNKPVFAFRLHQFISRGDTVYASLESPDQRHITLEGQQYVPGHRDKTLLPLSFCRECGQEYYTVHLMTDEQNGKSTVAPRQLSDQVKDEKKQRGFLYYNPSAQWTEDVDQLIAQNKLPEDWLEPHGDGFRVKQYQRKNLPQPLTLNTEGQEADQGITYFFVKSPFPFCLCCGVAYTGWEQSDFGKLAGLSSEGRSTATTILSLSALRALQKDGALTAEAQKILSFTDNRQDASLQAGHLNDFVEVGLLRSALYRAVADSGDEGLAHDRLAQAVFDALALPYEQYAHDPTITGIARRRQVDQALREVLAYRLYRDLRRGWRLTAPNLEQLGLLQIAYLALDEISANPTYWQGKHPTLVTASAQERYNVCKTLLDLLRRELAIRVDYLDAEYQERLRQKSSQNLGDPWAIDETEKLDHSYIAIPGSSKLRRSGSYSFVSARGGFGLYLRRASTFPAYDDRKLSVEDTEQVIRDLFAVLDEQGLLDIVEDPRDKDDVAGYQLAASMMIWKYGEGTTPFHDPIRLPRQSSAELETNRFFIHFYKEIASRLTGVQAREHTAQVPSAEREKREEAFREAKLPILYCSPTMELGVDISQLNVVNMRNVPPTPANYAQRSGRAGRSGQPALVFTYCTTGSPHDQYFFKRPSLMVAGAVRPPRLDLGNEDLLKAHIHAVWLAETGVDLGSSLKAVLDVDEEKLLEIRDSLRQQFGNTAARGRARARLRDIFHELQAEISEASWYSDEWLDQQIQQAATEFDKACNRWRDLYKAALNQLDTQHDISRDPSRTTHDKRQAQRLYSEARSQLDLLLDTDERGYSDFYSYRYFASEGFLPGYNFPRLPLSAYIPARRGRRRQVNDRDEFLSRPRFLAISEFGPRSIIYHEGSRYVINKVILPVSEHEDESGRPMLTSSAVVCSACGYLHPVRHADKELDLCEYCGHKLGAPMTSLFRMRNVATRRRDRINSDEEERMRMGYELQTSVRFEEHSGRSAYSTAVVQTAAGEPFLKMTYGNGATIWRINKGWRRRKEQEVLGFVLDLERGFWQNNKDDIDNDPDDPLSPRTERVIPFVEDRRNCLLLTFSEAYDLKTMASLQPAIKNAIQVLYQLEDNELAAEPLPSLQDRQYILLYESAEGGAGVLRQLMTDPEAIREVARRALALCHFDPETLADKWRAENAREDCEAACYHCLRSYYNQPDHLNLDRQLVKPILGELAAGVVALSPTTLAQSDHVTALKAQCDSDLERAWLDMLAEQGFGLPDEAQKYLDLCQTRCDFYFTAHNTAVYIDGPHHDTADIQTDDQRITTCLEYDLGLQVIRFRYDQQAEWIAQCRQYPQIFGGGRP